MELYHKKLEKLDYTIAIVFIRAITLVQNINFLPEDGFETQSTKFLILFIRQRPEVGCLKGFGDKDVKLAFDGP